MMKKTTTTHNQQEAKEERKREAEDVCRGEKTTHTHNFFSRSSSYKIKEEEMHLGLKW